MRCSVCQSVLRGDIFESTDRLTGDKKLFTYTCCKECGTLQLTNPPVNMSLHYPENYYSYTDNVETSDLVSARTFIEKYGINEKHSILDYGAGGLTFISALYQQGAGQNEYQLRAYDPYAEPHEVKGLKIQDKIPTDRTFDYVRLNHSIEHSLLLSETLSHIKAVTHVGSKVIISTPNPNSFAFWHYGINWVQLDAPRHVYLMPPPALAVLMAQCGFKYVSKEFNGMAFGLVMSDYYEQGLTFKKAEALAKEELNAVKWKHISNAVDVLNMLGKGDQYNVIFERIA